MARAPRAGGGGGGAAAEAPKEAGDVAPMLVGFGNHFASEALPGALDARIALADVTLAAALAERRVLTAPTGVPAMPVTAALFG